MARRPVDYTTQLDAAAERRRQQEEKQREEAQRMVQLRERQAASYGELVLEILGDRVSIDELAGRLLDTVDRTKANPDLKKEWVARGEDFFRPAGNAHRKQPAAGSGANGNGVHPVEPGQPPRHRRAASPGGGDLLNGLAADRSGPGTPGESGGADEQP
jgi:hypothetical protein